MLNYRGVDAGFGLRVRILPRHDLPVREGYGNALPQCPRDVLVEDIEAAAELSEGALVAHWEASGKSHDLPLSRAYACADCGESFSPPSHAALNPE